MEFGQYTEIKLPAANKMTQGFKKVFYFLISYKRTLIVFMQSNLIVLNFKRKWGMVFLVIWLELLYEIWRLNIVIV